MASQKPINKVSKGRRVENLCKKIFKDNGYLVDSKPRTKWTSPDLFGQFDFIAVKKSYVDFVQVKSNVKDFYKAKKQIKLWITSQNLNLKISLWLYLGRNKWRVFEPILNNSQEVDNKPTDIIVDSKDLSDLEHKWNTSGDILEPQRRVEKSREE